MSDEARDRDMPAEGQEPPTRELAAASPPPQEQPTTAAPPTEEAGAGVPPAGKAPAAVVPPRRSFAGLRGRRVSLPVTVGAAVLAAVLGAGAAGLAVAAADGRPGAGRGYGQERAQHPEGRDARPWTRSDGDRRGAHPGKPDGAGDRAQSRRDTYAG